MILQERLPYDPLAPRPLPGIAPLDPEQWLRVDEAYAGQMAERERLIEGHRAAVIVLDESARDMAEELLDEVVAAVLALPGFSRSGDTITRPDGGTVVLCRDDPLATVGRLCQEDLCLLDKRGDEHVLVGACLCFPASWSLEEKFMRSLIGIHVPVAPYDADIARRVQRLCDGVQPGRPLWRFNALWYEDASLHQPRRENGRRAERHAKEAPYLRSELQTLRRLAKTKAVVFGIHTFVLHKANVPGRG
ncbi:DUF3445 domain-containing protein [Aquicoccus sp. G2-2]|uniref:heme-dependent oxidative N-demethylase family protein n=1 Tax=Aquicoccus sp. G2-2 TaxID=3092120 RepID=UPI002AE064C0|nr:DUF3445 domain-containing protein [Aquicoccus sp. G2-2]MEA1113472.1 DUF3445 domain-containing protein [Aquicoccus sp. G2-2]